MHKLGGDLKIQNIYEKYINQNKQNTEKQNESI